MGLNTELLLDSDEIWSHFLSFETDKNSKINRIENQHRKRQVIFEISIKKIALECGLNETNICL